jgi:hypothetical protein
MRLCVPHVNTINIKQSTDSDGYIYMDTMDTRYICHIKLFILRMFYMKLNNVGIMLVGIIFNSSFLLTIVISGYNAMYHAEYVY